ncbi:MAG TPA: DegT/DnrJ/EryC1/StrS family aminotransferase [Vicinamibacterales bacterium]|nr:DegT/DnrJ/EryC1/StrS family aminotransferase [Vicinamibacterales bacterium]
MLPVNEPLLDGREKELLIECIDSGWVSSDGPFVPQFERQFADYIGTRHGVAVCNGTAALETALFAAGVGDGDEVIMPTFTIVSCLVAALRLGATPVLVDAEPDTWGMDVSQLASKISPRTKAIMPVHMYGHPVDMDPVMALANQHGLIVIEDAAEVHGAEYRGQRCGSIGQISAWSFYANKIINTGEGGMVLTSDDGMAERARSYRNLCFRPERRFYHTELGYNFRMTNLQAALGVAQVERVEEFVAIKRRLGQLYREQLAAIPGLRFQIEKPWAKSVYWMYCVEVDSNCGFGAADVQQALGRRGIGTRPFFLGLHEQPAAHDRGLFVGERYPVSERIARQGFYLPSGLTLTESQVSDVVAALGDAMAELRARPSAVTS